MTRKISLEALNRLASQLSECSPYPVGHDASVYDDFDYIGVMYCSPILANDELRLISRCLRGVDWNIEKFDKHHFFISFNRDLYLKK